jgi:hypothetical protein
MLNVSQCSLCICVVDHSNLDSCSSSCDWKKSIFSFSSVLYKNYYDALFSVERKRIGYFLRSWFYRQNFSKYFPYIEVPLSAYGHSAMFRMVYEYTCPSSIVQIIEVRYFWKRLLLTVSHEIPTDFVQPKEQFHRKHQELPTITMWVQTQESYRRFSLL